MSEARHTIRNGMSAALITDASWRKSSYSGKLGNCVEIAGLGAHSDAVAVRNSRDPRGPALVFTRAELAAFVADTAGR